MEEQIKKQLREEWMEKLFTKEGNSSKYWLPSGKDVADWWLSKIDSLLQSQKDELVEKIREATGVMRTSETDKIINLINQNN